MSALVKDLSVTARRDLQRDGVQIFYEIASKINGQPSLALDTDFYPFPLPTDPLSQFNLLQFTVDLQGIATSVTTAKITTEVIDVDNPLWWLGKHPQYKPWDASNPADAQNPIASFVIDATSLTRAANPPADAFGNAIADKGYLNELTTGQLTDWMGFQSQRITLTIKAVLAQRDGTMPHKITLTYQCLSTNAAGGTYKNQQVAQQAEPVPIGLAQLLFNAIHPLQYQGQLTLQEEDVSGSLLIGQLFNLTGGALTEWTTMAAQVQEIDEDLDLGTTRVSFGPSKQLTAGDLVDLLRINRARTVMSGYAMRTNGTPANANGDVSLGQNTPEKNSVSGTATANPHVITATVDGSGQIITLATDGANPAIVIGPPPLAPGVAPLATPNGSITIALADAGGNDVFFRYVPCCLNGISGKMMLLCGPFIPDA